METDTSEVIAYTHLVLCTGSRARKLSISGSDLGGIHYLRSAHDENELNAEDYLRETFVHEGIDRLASLYKRGRDFEAEFWREVHGDANSG